MVVHVNFSVVGNVDVKTVESVVDTVFDGHVYNDEGTHLFKSQENKVLFGQDANDPTISPSVVKLHKKYVSQSEES